MNQLRANVYPLILLTLAAVPIACGAVGESTSGGQGDGDELPSGARVGETQSEIIGGFEPWPHTHPWIASVTFGGAHNCGGSLIHPSWVLTAAHCLDGFATSSLGVVMGEHLLDASDGAERSRTVAAKFIHPSYDPLTAVNDIGLIRLTSPVPINENIQTIAMPSTTPTSGVVRLAGWGKTDWDDVDPSNALLQVSAGIRPVSDCNNTSELFRDLTANEICWGSSTSGGCKGDSGGPLQHRAADGRVTQLGIVSWGSVGCDSHTVFTRVQSYLGWINSTVGAPLRRNVRMRWSGNLANPGHIRLTCASTGEVVTGPVDVDGVEISLDCPGANVTARCSVTASGRSVDGFTRKVGGVTTNLPYTSTLGTNTFAVPSSGTVDYWCGVTD